MNAKLKIKMLISLGCILVVSLAVVFGTNIIHEAKQSEKQVVFGNPSWPAYTFETAIKNATTVVYGRVASISDTLMHEATDSSGKVHQDYYKEVKIKVIDLLKGEGSPKTITYLEMGGETDTHIYKILGYEPLVDSEEYVLFLNKYGACLSPATVMLVNDGKITVTSSMLPPVDQAINGNIATVSVEELKNYIASTNGIKN